MSRTTSHRILTSTALALLVLGAPAPADASPAPRPPAAAVSAPATVKLWLQGLWDRLAGPSGIRDEGAARGSRGRRGSGLQCLPQADGSYIDPNGGKAPEPPPPLPPQ